MKLYMFVLLMISTLLLSSCGGAINVPYTKQKDPGMNMKPVKVIPTNSDWTATGNLSPNQDVHISILLKDKKNKPITSFQTVEEKLMHLIVVSKDLSYFAHIHPIYKGNGLFVITTRFPTAGEYKLTADFTPAGGVDSSIQTYWLHINGNVPPAKPIVPDQNLTKVVDGLKVTLSYNKNNMMSNMPLNMDFTFKDAKTNKPITDLQPYLGVMGHMVAMSSDVTKYTHVHPMTTKGHGPKVTFMALFPKKGVYKIWGQFQYEGRVIVVPYVVNVPS